MFTGIIKSMGTIRSVETVNDGDCRMTIYLPAMASASQEDIDTLQGIGGDTPPPSPLTVVVSDNLGNIAGAGIPPRALGAAVTPLAMMVGAAVVAPPSDVYEPSGSGILTLDAIDIGASIACHGVCLTVVEKGTDPRARRGGAGPDWFAVDVSQETLECTVLRDWKKGTRIHLEPSLRVGDEMGGHFILGHVDTVAEIVSRRKVGGSWRLRLTVPDAYAPYIVPKGSVALNGVSLTVNDVEEGQFGINLIPHTMSWTTFGALREGHMVNIEIDPIARYVVGALMVMNKGKL